ncbi:DUF4123 domain-containing protein [Paraburkholderia sediminicola]|uniref:DUF4123 domain-containing protein n=1 Tax=Paraburkholderia TaxID=1822464 RepID=UPI0038BB6B52
MPISTYVIVEPSNGEFDIQPAPNPYEIGELVPTSRPELEGVAPLLYRLEHRDRQMARVKEMAENHRSEGRPPLVCCFIDTAADTDTIRQHLAESLVLGEPTSGTVVFRYYDPRVFVHLRWILDTQQFLALMGPTTKWTYLSGAGTWVEIPSEGLPAHRLQVTEDQFRQLGRLPFVQRALEPLAAKNVAIPEDLPRLLDRQLVKAERYGLRDEDRVPFALHGVFVAPNFDQHPQVKSILADVGQMPYAEAVAEWTDDDWSRIARESTQYQY